METTVKTINFQYADMRTEVDTPPATYTPCTGILKGLTLATADPEAKTIDSEIFAHPFATIYQGKPLVMKFELTNYALQDLPPLVGGTYTAGVTGKPNTYDAPDDITPTFHEWKVSFQSGFDSLVIFKGETIGVVKKDADGALNVSVTVTTMLLPLGGKNYTYRINDSVIGA